MYPFIMKLSFLSTWKTLLVYIYVRASEESAYKYIHTHSYSIYSINTPIIRLVSCYDRKAIYPGGGVHKITPKIEDFYHFLNCSTSYVLLLI